jgi:hypothetical protein
MLRGQPIPPEAKDAYYAVEMETQVLTLDDLDKLPRVLIDRIIAYKAVKAIVLYGGELRI